MNLADVPKQEGFLRASSESNPISTPFISRNLHTKVLTYFKWLKEEDQRVLRYLLCLGQFSDHGLRGFDIFHNDKIFFIILDRESFSPANDFQLIALLKSKIEAQLRKLDFLTFFAVMIVRNMYSLVLFL